MIEYHNNAVYKAFEFYLKTSLAVLGGMAYVVTTSTTATAPRTRTLLDGGSWLLLVAALAFALVMFEHLKSKVERWVTRYAWWEPLLWAECVFVASMLSVSVVVRLLLVPAMLASITE